MIEHGETSTSARLAIDAMINRVRNTMEDIEPKFPHWADTDSGTWTGTEDGDWTGGAWVGELWLAARVTGEDAFAAAANRWRKRMEVRVLRNTSFKGFGFYHAAALGSILAGDSDARDMGIRCAKHLASMFDSRLGLIPLGSSAEEGQNVGLYDSSIDSLQASPLLAWAAHESGDKDLLEVAVRHTTRVLEIHVRPDGSVIQSSTLDPSDGTVIRYHTHKGYSDSSTWGRAQAWALLYSSGMAMMLPGHAQWVEYGKRVAEWWIANIPDDGVSFWDFDDPEIPAAPRDTGATAISSAGLLRLAEVVGGVEGSRYRESALRSIRAMVGGYLTPTTANDPRPVGMLTSGCFTKRTDQRGHDMAIDVELIFADYFLLESLCVLEGQVELDELMPHSRERHSQ